MRGRIPRLQGLPARGVDPHPEERTRADSVKGLQNTHPLQEGKAAGTQVLAAYLGRGSGRLVQDDDTKSLAGEERGRRTPGRTRADDDYIPISNVEFRMS